MLVTLLTDFGIEDHFVAAMKGVILERAPDVPLVDITHSIPPQDVRAAAFTLLAAYDAFPVPSVHLAVVDPGVGSARRPVVVSAGGRHFVGPDNGLFSYLLDREPGFRARHLNRPSYFRARVSSTFHGRDVFAPVAGSLAAGTPPEALGDEVDELVRLPPLRPGRGDHGGLVAEVVHVDRFGNCVTSLTPDHLPAVDPADGVDLRVGGHRIRRLRRFFAEEAGDPGEPFAIWGSTGFLEIAVNRGSAAQRLGIGRGSPVLVEEPLGPTPPTHSPGRATDHA